MAEPDAGPGAVPPQPVPQSRSWRERVRDSRLGNIGVVAVTTVAILAGVWIVKGMGKDEGADAAAGAGGSGEVSAVTLADTNASAPEVGQLAPDFTTFTTDGADLILSELRGKPVWLVFGATWCTNCRAEAPDIQAVQEQYGDQVAIVAIYVGEGVTTVSEYAQRVGLTYAQVADAGTEIGSEYRVMGIPEHVFLDASGVVRAIDLGGLSQDAAAARLDQLLGG